MQDKTFVTRRFRFIKHEGTLMVYPRTYREGRLLEEQYDNQFYEEIGSIERDYDSTDKLPYYISCYPVNTYNELKDFLTYCTGLGLKLCLSFDEFYQLSELFLIDDTPLHQKLKELDLRNPQFIYLNCKIKDIQTPRLTHNGKEYTQNITVYDDDTEKTIKAIMGNKSAEYDTWKNGDHVQIIGQYIPEYAERDLHIYEAIKIEESDEPTPITRENEIPGYDKWRNTILSKDNQKCVCCGHDKHLEAHHLFGYKEHPELAIEPDNGVTLCSFCHKKYHSIYGVKDINPRDFVEFVRRFGV